ncbi:MAG: DUF433 domain-containing protein [Dehalococcoidia bacterium]
MVIRAESAATDVPGIVMFNGPAGQRARIEGGVDVWKVVQLYKQTDGDIGRILDWFDWLTPGQVETALTYYRLHPAEIDQWIAEEDAVTVDRVHEALARRQELSARKKST